VRTLLAWALLGLVVGVFAQWTQLRGVDWDLNAVLRVGAESEARNVIVEELGSVPVTRGTGHDGQYFYLIARDPWAGKGYADLTDDGGYRFRRPLYGWLAGGFGTFSPRMTLIGLAVVAIFGMALAAAATADVASLLGTRWWAVFGVLGNLGLWLSVQLVTADALAMALAMLAVSLALRDRTGWAVLALAAAALTKDAYLLFAIGLGGWRFFEHKRQSAVALAVVPAIPLMLWVAWLARQVDGSLSAKDNFAWPLVGLIESFSQWETTSDLVQAIVALLAMAGALIIVVVTRHRLLGWLTVPWVVVALISSVVVWGDGNNAVRVFAPLWLFTWLGAAWLVQSRTTRVQVA
jgi:MFS family permease